MSYKSSKPLAARRARTKAARAAMARIRQARWKREHPEANRAYLLRRYRKDPLKHRAAAFYYRLLALFGPTGPEQARALFARQGGCCAACRCVLDPLGTRQTHVDHDHDTGRMRGVLCRGCNIGLGHFGDSPARLRTAATYLENPPR